MKNSLAQLSEDQSHRIDQLEAELGVVLVAFEGYQQENEQGETRA